MPHPGASRKVLSIKDKLAIIAKVDDNPNLTKVQLAKMLNLSPSSLNTILKNRAKLEKFAQEKSDKVKNVRCGKFEVMEKLLMEWFLQARASNIPLSGPIIKEKADQLALRMGIAAFKASNGWIDRFKKRYTIVYRQMHGESNSVTDETVQSWTDETLPRMIEGYAPRDCFNADELGLFYNLLPDRTFLSKGESCHGGKRSKERLTVLLCVNEDGSEKIKPLVIGKSDRPRCFKNINHLPCEYSANKSAWITGARFLQFLMSLEAKMRVRGRKIILFIDRCTAHPPDVIDQLQNVKVVFLPANTTSKLQPLDQGIIKVLKQHFRKRVVYRLLRHMDNAGRSINLASVPKLNVLDAMHYVAASWDNISPETITNCFRKAGFRKVPHADDPDYPPEANDPDDPPEANDLADDPDEPPDDTPEASGPADNPPEASDDNVIDASINSVWNRLIHNERLNETITFDQFVHHDDGLETCNTEAASINDIFEQNASSQLIDEAVNEDDADDDVVMEPPTFAQAMNSLETIRRFISSCKHVPDDVYPKIASIEGATMKLSAQKEKQSKLDTFFSYSRK